MRFEPRVALLFLGCFISDGDARRDAPAIPVGAGALGPIKSNTSAPSWRLTQAREHVRAAATPVYGVPRSRSGRFPVVTPHESQTKRAHRGATVAA